MTHRSPDDTEFIQRLVNEGKPIPAGTWYLTRPITVRPDNPPSSPDGYERRGPR